MGVPNPPPASVIPAALEGYQRVAVFAFGVVFVAVILYLAVLIPKPTDFQILVFRTVLGLAAAGIASLIPGFLHLQIASSLYIGGAIAVFWIVYSVNPPALVNPSFDPEYQRKLREGDGALTSQNYAAALESFAAALELRPGGEEALYGIGKANYHLERYRDSHLNFEQAFAASGQSNGNIAASLALASEAVGDFDAADRYYAAASNILGTTSDFGKETIYDRGVIALIRWLRSGAPAETEDCKIAERRLREFLDLGGIPRRWANYHLACIKATRATHDQLSEKDKAQLQAVALELFRSATTELLASLSNKAQLQRELLRKLLKTPESQLRRAGDPVGCPSLVALWSRTSGAGELLEQLS